jgi:drug/metabolite transporter (DMT)-like permease
MTKLFSLAALVAGVWLIAMGYQRQNSLAGRADDTISKIGVAVDGNGHATTQTKYYAAGAALALVGIIGLGVVRK